MDRFRTSYRHLVPVIVFFCVLQILLFAPRLNSDGAYYFEFVRSLVIQNDLNFDDEREFFTWEWVPVFRNYLPGDWDNTGYPPNIFSFGPAAAWLPVYLLVHWFVLLANHLGASFSTNGYSLLYRFFPLLMSLLCGLAALFAIDRLGRDAGYRPPDRAAGLFLMLGASHWPAFIFVTPAFSHSLSVLTVSIFLLAWYRSRDAGWNGKGYALYGVLGGLAVLARWQNLFCLVLPLLDAATSLVFSPDRRSFFRRFFRWTIFSAALLLTVSPQLIATWILYGTPVTDPQGEGGMLWMSPRIRLILFEGIKGLFTVNPILLVATLLIPLIFRKNLRLGWGLTVLFVIQLYINAVRRDWAGVGFGMRRFLNLVPVFALGLTAGFDWLRTRRRKFVIGLCWTAGIAAIVWNLLLMAQYYYSELGAPWTTFPPSAMIRNQFTEAPALLAKLVGSGLFASGLHGDAAHLILAVAGLLLTTLIIAVFVRLRPAEPALDRLFRRLLSVAVLWIAVLDGWLLLSAGSATMFHAIELLPGPHFGRPRLLRLNDASGYLGFPGGLVFGPGPRLCVMDVRAEYVRDQFLALGRLAVEPHRPCRNEALWRCEFAGQFDARSLILISRIPSGPVPAGTEIAEISVTDSTDRRHAFPVRAGYETGSGIDSMRSSTTDRLVRDYPAVNRMTTNNTADYRVTFDWKTSVSVRTLEIAFRGYPVVWEIHGLAFR